MKNVEINSKMPQETVTISREEYNKLIAQNKELSHTEGSMVDGNNKPKQ